MKGFYVMKQKTIKRAISLGTVTALSCIGIAFLPASSALAIGDSRTVERSCGKNHVSSGRFSDGTAWAQTVQEGGKNGASCAGRLSVAFELDNGYHTDRVYGDNKKVYATTNATNVKYALHWGCDNCSVTRS